MQNDITNIEAFYAIERLAEFLGDKNAQQLVAINVNGHNLKVLVAAIKYLGEQIPNLSVKVPFGGYEWKGEKPCAEPETKKDWSAKQWDLIKKLYDHSSTSPVEKSISETDLLREIGECEKYGHTQDRLTLSVLHHKYFGGGK